MRLKRYINERQEPINEWIPKAVNEIYKNVSKKMLKEMDRNGVLLRRNLGDALLQYKKLKTRPNRVPKDTLKIYHDWIDEWFEKKFGWKARSEHVLFCFTIDSFNKSFNYNIVFPINIEKVIWSEKIDDLTYDLRGEKIKTWVGEWVKRYDLDRKNKELTKEKFHSFLEKSKYKEGSIGKFLKEVEKNLKEVMIKCKEYYIINLGDVKHRDRIEFFKGMKMYRISSTLERRRQ